MIICHHIDLLDSLFQRIHETYLSHLRMKRKKHFEHISPRRDMPKTLIICHDRKEVACIVKLIKHRFPSGARTLV